MFRAAFGHTRCMVPADADYEWRAADGGKRPYAFARLDEQPIMLAGLWDIWRVSGGEIVRSFTIITTRVNATPRAVHDRMLVILEPDNWPLRLGEAEGNAAELLRSPAYEVLRVWQVSRHINSPRNNDVGLRDAL
jgi:putative SOS response-associated peptidase YedK